MRNKVRTRLFRSISFALLLAAACLASGCIRTRVKIESQPTGAEVIWRGKPYAATPVTIPIIWYWYYDFALEKPGYKRLEVMERFRTPPWILFPLDIVMETLPIPIPYTYERSYVLEPLAPGETAPVRETEIDPQKLGLTPPAVGLP